MLKLLGERLTGEPMESYSNHHMERGKVMEEEAADLYAMLNGGGDRIGFIRNGDKGCSPDLIVGDDGLVEIKSKLPHIHLAALFDDKVPSEHIAQVQGQLWVAEREWCDFMSYWPGLRPFIKRVYRDEEYIKKLSAEVDRFNDELNALQQRYEA